jgi:FAD:protein FMN transferase
MKLKKLICIVMISVLGVPSFAGCAKKQDEKKTETSSEASTQEASAQVFAMDTYMNLKAYGKNAQKAVDDAKSEIERLDQLWSAVDKNSEIYQLRTVVRVHGKMESMKAAVRDSVVRSL